MINRIFGSISGFIIAISLVSCGGGDSQHAEGGIGGTGISSGSVTGYGSIIVNGVHFDTTGAVITKDDGTPVTNVNDADINQFFNLGMVVTVKGTINDDGLTGKAASISYDDILEGPVVGNPVVGTPINVLGQKVNVTDSTVYVCDESNSNATCSLNGIDGFGFDGLTDGQVIEVSGFIDQYDHITAAYIELKKDTYTKDTDNGEANVFELKGKAKVTGSNPPSINIGELTFDTSNFTSIDTAVFDGKFVQAKGTFDGTTTLKITEAIEIKSESFDINDADKAELEGIVTTATTCITNICDFTLSGMTVRVDSSTTFNIYGVTYITAGVKLEAEGELQGGILYANEIEFKY